MRTNHLPGVTTDGIRMLSIFHSSPSFIREMNWTCSGGAAGGPSGEKSVATFRKRRPRQASISKTQSRVAFKSANS
ncbi:MAG TPA: hypothetical protein VFS10_11235 [Pyrinomonadaceae bacterium]|nr:hypothetical protein [Pyrinomonadaceae bacterium]